MVAAANTEASNLDQAGQFARRSDQQLSRDCVEMDTVVTHQNGGWKLARTAGEDQIERQP
jgi:hypothetical protein